MAARIPLSWLVLIIVAGVFIFFGYHIVQASSNGDVERFPPYSEHNAAKQGGAAHLVHTVNKDIHNDDSGYVEESTAAPVVDRTPPHAMPRVPGQTEEDLRTPEPLQRTPPTTEYEPPSHRDPLNPTVNADAEFGSNFRHPEQMIETHPRTTMAHVPQSGLGSERSSPGGNDANGYAPEMLQNGAQWMTGVTAFDNSEEGTSYSMI